MVLAAMISFTVFSCKKEAQVAEPGIPAETLSKISALGFSTSNVIAVDGGYLVEGDIFLTDANLNYHPSTPILRVGNAEQYHTYNLVSVSGGTRNITISSSGSVNSNVSNAINAAINRYNAENLQLTFTRVSSGGNINVRVVNGGPYIASAGFPENGNPYPEVKFNRQYQNYSSGFLTTVMAHEIGHCIGFRHTDYMNRAYSCGSGGNEGAGSVGAVHIPNTPTGPDPGSWMLACLSSSTDRPFNSADKIALGYLY